MADTCGNCDCADRSQCTKKGYSLDIIETDGSYTKAAGMVMDAPVAEHNDKCKCGSSCACTNCTCGQ